MKYFLYSFVLVLLFSCSQSEEASYSLEDVEVSGEFLFEGPNSLQGQLGNAITKISEDKNIEASQIQSVYLKSCTVEFPEDEVRNQVENILVQMVSEKLNLVSVATINGIPESGPISLSSSEEQDILPYLKDPTTTLVLDANLKQDMDELSCKVSFDLKILY